MIETKRIVMATPELAGPGPAGGLGAAEHHVLEAAAARMRFDTTGATLLTPGVFRLPAADDGAGAVAKIHRLGTTREAALRQATVASWVLEHDIPTARPLGRPTSVRGQMVSFTRDLGPGRPADPEERAALLALLHALPAPTGLPLPETAPTASLQRRLDALPATVVNGDARKEVWTCLQMVERLWNHLEPLTRRRLVHGNTDPSHTVVGRDGIPNLINWTAAAIGPPGLDLASEAFRRDGFGADPRDYERFHAEYGHDITQDDTGRTYAVLAARAAAAGVITAAEHAVHDPQWRPEYLLRLSCLSALGDPARPYPWTWRAGSQLTVPPQPPACLPGPGGPARPDAQPGAESGQLPA
ncbi:hypothetical protein OG196_14315 [Kitasatospora purpeofusca]|uniref:hypothetical protein n=1 Tax=Kitasatospora purpeofusca TaxID=67352 RepID=UPI002E110A83|nr:hypothetical protein OG196_14315 [Kitasatospora purpeofusca]